MNNTIALISLGCAKNLVNSEQMLYLLSEAGYAIAAEPDGADAVIINTCGFIDAAKSEAIDTILEMAQLKNEGKLGKIIVTGCLTERYREAVTEELPEIDAILGVGNYKDIVETVEKELLLYLSKVNFNVNKVEYVLNKQKRAKELNLNVKVGNTICYDQLYRDDDEFEIKKWAEYGVIGGEMEAAGLYTVASHYGKQALCMFTIVVELLKNSDVTSGSVSNEQREKGLNDMITLALETIIED